MSRHRRHRVPPSRPTPPPAQRAGPLATHPARVRVDDVTWQAFKLAVGERTIAEELGDMVARRVQRHHALAAQAGSLSDRELLNALDRAIETRADLGRLIQRIEDRLDSRGMHAVRPIDASDLWADGPVSPPSTDV